MKLITRNVQIGRNELNELLRIKKEIKAHNMTEVIQYLLNSEKENKLLTDKVNDIEKRLSKLEGVK